MKTFLLSLLLALPLHAQLIESFSGGDSFSVGPGTAGYEFIVGPANLTLQSLGVWDDSGTGLSSSHAVGIWDAGRHLIASAVVTPNGSTDVNGFWYVGITPLTLQAGSRYTIAAQYADSDFDFARANVPTFKTAPGITFVSAVLSTASGFEFPDIELPQVAGGFFGPNSGFAPIPEPCAFALLTGVCLVAWSAVRKRGLALGVMLALACSAYASPQEKPKSRELSHAKRRQPLTEDAAQTPATNRPPSTPGNDHGNRPIVPPGLNNYATP